MWAKWGAFVGGLAMPKLLTLTLPSTVKAKDGLRALQKAWGRFRNMRIGGRARARLWAEVEAFILSPKRDIKPLKRAQLLKSSRRYLEGLGASRRVRDVLGQGLSSLEGTYSRNGFHWHYHVVFSGRGQYIPWPVLAVLWGRASGVAGAVLDIRKLRGPKAVMEVLKYVSKPGAILPSKQQEFCDALKGVRRVRPIGGAKPTKAAKLSCPCCGEPSCARSARESLKRVAGNRFADALGELVLLEKHTGGRVYILRACPSLDTTTDSATERMRAGEVIRAGPGLGAHMAT